MANTLTEQEDVANIIRAMDEEFTRNVAAKNAEKLAKDFYAEDARLLVPHQEPVLGRLVIQQTFEALIGGPASVIWFYTRIGSTHLETSPTESEPTR